MQNIGAFQAKTHLSQLLNAVENQKETIAITRHGHIVALLVPPQQTAINPVTQAIDTINRLRKGVTLGKNLTIKQLIEQGRR